MRLITCIALLVSIIAYDAPAMAAESSTCKLFFDDIQEHVNTILKDSKMSFSQKRDSLTTLFEKAVDVNWIAQKVSETIWNSASEQDRTDFINAYRPYLANHYIGGLDEEDYNEMLSLLVTSFTSTERDIYLVKTQVKRKADDAMIFEIRLEEQPQSVCHVRDFTIEGVSQISTQHDEIQSLATKGGLKSVTQRLKELQH